MDGTATMETLAIIEKTARSIVNTADCAIGRDAARLVVDGLEGFRDDYVEHICHHRCLAGLEIPVPCVNLCPAGVDIPGYMAVSYTHLDVYKRQDMQPQIAVVLSLAQGTSLVTEGVYGASRFKYLDELRRMGAHIQVDGRVAVIEGVEQLEGAPVHACDLRAGAALVIAGLAARGTTEISQIQFIERGYEDLVGKLRAVGADIQMVDVPVEAAENEAQIS